MANEELSRLETCGSKRKPLQANNTPIAITDGGEDVYKGEAKINYLSIDGKEPKTVPVSLREVDESDEIDGKEIVFSADDDDESDDIRFLVCETRDGSIKLHTHDGYNVNGGLMTNLAFPRDDGQTIKVEQWKHDDEHVKNIVLNEDLFTVIDEAIQDARENQNILTVSEATTEADIDIPEIPLIIKEITSRKPTWSGTTRAETLTVVPTDDVDQDDWELWSGAFCKSGDYHDTHITSNEYIMPPEGSNWAEGDELTFHELIDGWHCVDALDVINEVESELESRRRAKEREQERAQLKASYEAEVKKQYEVGTGEGHALKADLKLTDTETGETVDVTTRNAVDIGWQAFGDSDTADTLLDNGGREYLREFGPLPTGFRMTPDDRGW